MTTGTAERYETEEGRERGDGIEEEEEEEEESGRRRVEKRMDPRMPTSDERKEHEMTHIPFRNWCRHCVRGRGKEEACRKTEREEGRVPEVHMDFMFMGEEKGGKTLAILVVKERSTKAVMATVAPRKSSGEWLSKRVMAWLREVGCGMCDMNMKSDNEPALVAVVNGVDRERAVRGAGRMVIEHSPVHSSQSNGYIERAVQTVQGVIRTMRSALEEKWGVSIGIDHAVWSWLVEYAGWLITRCEVGKDGRTPYERMKGKKGRIQGMEFGEGVWWKRRREGGPLGKLTSMWENGVFLGVKGTTGEIIVGDERGVWATRTVRRKPEEERWQRENLERIVGVPWRKSEEEEGDGEGMRTDVRVMDKDYRERLEGEERAMPVPRRVYISKADLDRWGYTVGCPGCVSIIRRTARQGHTEACRKRMESELEETEKARGAERRQREFLDEAMRRDARRKEGGRGRGEEWGIRESRRGRGDEMLATKVEMMDAMFEKVAAKMGFVFRLMKKGEEEKRRPAAGWKEEVVRRRWRRKGRGGTERGGARRSGRTWT